MFAIFNDERIKIFNNDGEDVIKSCLLNEGIDDIIFETNESNVDLMAIDFDVDSENNRKSQTFGSDFKSAENLIQIPEDISNSFNEQLAKSVDKESELSSNVIESNESQITSVKSSDNSFETTVSDMSPTDRVFTDKTDKESLNSIWRPFLVRNDRFM